MMDQKPEINLPLNIMQLIENQPHAVNDLLWELGYERVSSPDHLPLAVQALIDESGQEAVDMILDLDRSDQTCGCKSRSRKKSTEDNLCGACGGVSYTGGPETDYLEEIASMSTEKLNQRYQELKKEAKAEPNDLERNKEIEIIWNELRMRQVTAKEVSLSRGIAHKVRVERALGLGLLAGCFLLGLFVATQVGKGKASA